MAGSLSPQIRQANELAVQFPHLSAEEGAKSVATHIRMFWEPRMRADLLRLAETDSDSFEPLALAAARLLAA